MYFSCFICNFAMSVEDLFKFIATQGLVNLPARQRMDNLFCSESFI